MSNQLALFDVTNVKHTPPPPPLIPPDEAERVLADLNYGCRMALDATVELLQACRQTRYAAISLAEGEERARQMRYGKTVYPAQDCMQWYTFISHHPSVNFGQYLPTPSLYGRAEILLTAVHQAANGYMREARVTIGIDEWTDEPDEDEAEDAAKRGKKVTK